MSVSSGHAKLQRASKDLLARWNGTRLFWRDDVSRKFDQNHLTPLLKKLRAAQEAMSHMDAILNQVRRDCE